MFMKVLVRVGVRVFMGVHDIHMLVLMAVLMGVFVSMQVPVFVGAFHLRSSQGQFGNQLKRRSRPRIRQFPSCQFGRQEGVRVQGSEPSSSERRCWTASS